MAKKKKKKKKQQMEAMKALDKHMDDVHERVLEELTDMKAYIQKKDKKIKKKTDFSSMNGVLTVFNPQQERESTRMKVVKTLKKHSLIDVVTDILKESMPIVKAIARVFSALILLIFDCPSVRNLISPKFQSKMEGAYEIAMAIH